MPFTNNGFFSDLIQSIQWFFNLWFLTTEFFPATMILQVGVLTEICLGRVPGPRRGPCLFNAWGVPWSRESRSNDATRQRGGVVSFRCFFFRTKEGNVLLTRGIYMYYMKMVSKKEGRNIISEICIVYYFSDLCKKRNHHGILGR